MVNVLPSVFVTQGKGLVCDDRAQPIYFIAPIAGTTGMTDHLCLYSNVATEGNVTKTVLFEEPCEVNEETTKPVATAMDAPVTEGKKSGLRAWLKFPHSWADVKKLGWKFIVGFILFYLIRDGILYILLPYLAYKGIIGK